MALLGSNPATWSPSQAVVQATLLDPKTIQFGADNVMRRGLDRMGSQLNNNKHLLGQAVNVAVDKVGNQGGFLGGVVLNHAISKMVGERVGGEGLVR